MNFENRRVLITGISGFVGSYLARYLLNQGAEVYGILRRRADWSIPQNLVERGIYGDLKLIDGDLLDISSIARALDVSQPEIVFHLGAQSFVPQSFVNPVETMQTNCIGTLNLLEAIRIKNIDPVVVFAGSSEEYGLVISSEKQYQRIKSQGKTIHPEPERIPELPIKETNPLRPMSPYAVSKVYGDFLFRNYYHSYGLKTIVSRAFNHEGAGRGKMFVTANIALQVMKLRFGEVDRISIGNVNAFRDWSHVEDIVKGYCLLALKGKYGEVYNQGSMRTNSVLSYILLVLEMAGYTIERIETFKGEKKVEKPTEISDSEFFGVKFEKTVIDEMMLKDEIYFELEDKGIFAFTDKGKVAIEFDATRFRPAEVPILLSDTRKVQDLGFRAEHSIKDIIRDQLNYYLDARRRN
ncbi:MAG: GDP-mannose 4,6-dehydratase [Archaeoglobales archaeon]|nr:GDP-mannose 4,6-dehydratase [Archaeoglobales archaeon]